MNSFLLYSVKDTAMDTPPNNPRNIAPVSTVCSEIPSKPFGNKGPSFSRSSSVSNTTQTDLSKRLGCGAISPFAIWFKECSRAFWIACLCFPWASVPSSAETCSQSPGRQRLIESCSGEWMRTIMLKSCCRQGGFSG